MQLIHCTNKLQKEMGLKKADLCEVEPKFSYLGSWHANLIYVGGRKCILFAMSRHFSILSPPVFQGHMSETLVICSRICCSVCWQMNASKFRL